MTQKAMSEHGKYLFPVFIFIYSIVMFQAAAFSDQRKTDVLPYEDPLQKASLMELHNDPYWWTLLHYKKGLFGIESLVDDPSFFLSNNGKSDPKAELDALIQTFILNTAGKKIDICRFIARYTWVRDKLSLSEKLFPKLYCDKALKIKPRSATVVFPTYFLNNPASMFGHTFINISTEYSNKLLSNAVNYAAYVDSGGFFYTFSGIFGLFKGYYSILPYYKKIQEYSDMDQRDMWEYSLNLTGEELNRMLLHIIEMDKIYSAYFFFDENCSYNLLFLLEAARPGVNLTDTMGPWVIPIDTIRAIKEAGFIDSVSYRPSIVTDIKHKMSQLSSHDVYDAIGLLRGAIKPSSILDSKRKDEDKAGIFELSSELTKYQYIKKNIERKTYSSQLMSILKSRSKLGKFDEKSATPRPFREPSEGHNAGRISVAAGVREGNSFQEVAIRPALTDFLTCDYDKDVGIQLQILNARLRYSQKKDATRLEAFDLFNVASLTPGDRFFKTKSWKVAAGARRRKTETCDDKLVGTLTGGVGISRYHENVGIFYGMMVGRLDAAKRLNKNVDFGAGIESGLLTQWTNDIKTFLSGSSLYFSSGSDYNEHSLKGTLYVRLFRYSGLGIESSVFRYGRETQDESIVFLNVFF